MANTRRRPTIHVTIQDLAKILKKLGIENPNELAINILKAAQPYQKHNRVFPRAFKNVRQEVDKVLQSNKNDVRKLNSILFNNKLTLYTNNQLRENTAMYRTLQDICGHINEFCIRNNYSKDEGYPIYVMLATDIMGKKFTITKFAYLSADIQKRYDISEMLSVPEYRNKVDLMSDAYINEAKNHTNFVRPINTIDDKGYLLWAIKDADTAEANYDEWIIAQFEGLAFLDDIPKLSQLSGDNALSRYYSYKERLGYKKQEKQKEVFTEYASEDERKYFERLRSLRDED